RLLVEDLSVADIARSHLIFYDRQRLARAAVGRAVSHNESVPATGSSTIHSDSCCAPPSVQVHGKFDRAIGLQAVIVSPANCFQASSCGNTEGSIRSARTQNRPCASDRSMIARAIPSAKQGHGELLLS